MLVPARSSPIVAVSEARWAWRWRGEAASRVAFSRARCSVHCLLQVPPVILQAAAGAQAPPLHRVPQPVPSRLSITTQLRSACSLLSSACMLPACSAGTLHHKQRLKSPHGRQPCSGRRNCMRTVCNFVRKGLHAVHAGASASVCTPRPAQPVVAVRHVPQNPLQPRRYNAGACRPCSSCCFWSGTHCRSLPPETAQLRVHGRRQQAPAIQHTMSTEPECQRGAFVVPPP
jgi:hypothetical protein